MSIIPRHFSIFAFSCLALCQVVQAVRPPPDGGYAGGNTAEGQNALFGLSTGGYNTAVGFLSLKGTGTNNLNRAVGAGTLLANTADANTAVGAGALLNNDSGTLNTATGAEKNFQARLAKQEKRIEDLTAALQKVGAAIELGRPKRRITASD